MIFIWSYLLYLLDYYSWCIKLNNSKTFTVYLLKFRHIKIKHSLNGIKNLRNWKYMIFKYLYKCILSKNPNNQNLKYAWLEGEQCYDTPSM